MEEYENPSYLNHQLVGAMSVGNEVRLDQRTESEPFPFLVHFLWQGLGKSARLGARCKFRMRPSQETEHTNLPSVELE
jgi:hypothetical protein